MQKKVFISSLILSLFLSIYPGGKEEAPYDRAEGVETWTYNYNLEGLDDGRYNIIIKGRDKAGNVTLGGPFNIQIDGTTDFPTLSIVNPIEGSLIKDNLNVVGSAFDDDGISRVEISVDGGPYLICEGTEFWSHYIDLNNLSDGPHQIMVRAVDINGLTGEESLINYGVDKDIPIIEIISHEKGSYLGKSVVIEGTLQDSGGIDELKYIHRETGEQGLIKVKYDKSTSLYHFEHKINTKDLEDGPHNITYICTDTSGSRGEENFLFYADNRSPEITILTPAKGDKVNQSLFIAGNIFDSVGIKSLSCLIGDQEWDIDFLKGSSYWYKEIDLTNVKTGKRNLILRAEDLRGNITEEKLQIDNNGVSDLPVVQVFLPDEIGIEEKSVDISLLAYDDDGVKGIEYTLDDNTPVLERTEEAARISFLQLTPGKHTLKAKALDINDLYGRELSFSFSIPKQSEKLPLKGLNEINFKNDEIVLRESGKITVEGYLEGLINGINLQYLISGKDESTWQPLFMENNGSFTVEIPDSNLEDGSYVLNLKGQSDEGNVTLSQIIIIKDSNGPELTLLSPAVDEKLNGKIILSGLLSDRSMNPSISVSDDGENYIEIGKGSSFTYEWDLNQYEKAPDVLTFLLTDIRGNTRSSSYAINIDQDSDIPYIELHYPREDSLITGPVSFTGTAIDDDGISSILYKIDEGDWSDLSGGSTFSFTYDPGISPDGDHRVFLKCIDSNGRESEIFERGFSVSRKAPQAMILDPSPETFLSGLNKISGTAQDDNGIREIQISTDNGMSYHRVEGAEEWDYELDTGLLPDGTNPVFIKAVDNSGMVSFFTSIINVDNSYPLIKINKPESDEIVNSSLTISGVVLDNNDLAEIYYSLNYQPENNDSDIFSLEESEKVSLLNEPVDQFLFSRVLDFSERQSGWYNLSIEAVDFSGNQSRETRSFYFNEKNKTDRIKVLYPISGASLRGFVPVEGYINDAIPGEAVQILINGELKTAATIDEKGYFYSLLGYEDLTAGDYELQVKKSEDSISELRLFSYEDQGPWVLFDGYKSGDYLTERTYLSGRTGYNTLLAENEDFKQPRPDKIEISFDKGRSQIIIPGKKVDYDKKTGIGSWKVRIETEQYADGILPVLVKATYDDGTSCSTEIMLFVDKKAPLLEVTSPSEGESFNNSLTITGNSEDDNGMDEVTLLLREGDKNNYEVPSFVQGLFLDFHVLGATYGEIGAGLTFFDDNVKLQAAIGISPPGRFSGLVMGGKLLANVASFPYTYFFGPDWHGFSTSLALGANFSYFTMSESELAFTDKGVVLGSVLGQWEIIKYEIPEMAMFNTYSLYLEGSLWFISSDVQAGLVPRFSIGCRVGVF